MNTSLFAFLLQNPGFFAGTFLIQPLGIAAILYGIVWWILRPKNAKGVVQARYHWLGLFVTVLGWAIIRVFAMATFAGRSALTYDSPFSMVAYFLIPPAAVATLYIRWLLNAKFRAVVQKKLETELPSLIVAAAEGNNKEVKSIISSGTSPDAAGPDGQTALMLAVRNGHISTAELLLSLGASLDSRTKVGNTARDIAVKFGHTDIQQLLERAAGLARSGVNS